MNIKPIFILAGPTASGKSDLAMQIAGEFGLEIVNCDSKQIYKQIPIITAQPILADLEKINHHLYGHINCNIYYSVDKWLSDVVNVINAIFAKGKLPLLVGGTGMYIKALTEGLQSVPDIDAATKLYVNELFNDVGNDEFHNLLRQKDPFIASKLHANDSSRIKRAMEVFVQTGKSLSYYQKKSPQKFFKDEQFTLFFLNKEREEIYRNCAVRLENMLANNLLQEVRNFMDLKINTDLPAYKAHGIIEFIDYIKGTTTLEYAKSQVILNTKHYIKRQYTWARHRMEGAINLQNDIYSSMKSTIKDKIKSCQYE